MVFERLRATLARHAPQLVVAEDTDTEYNLAANFDAPALVRSVPKP